MNEFLNFLMNHWQLSAGFVALLLAYLVFEFMQANNKQEISPDQAVSLYNHQHAVILDIRSHAEFNNGHIVGSAQMDVSEEDSQLKKLNKYERKPLIIVSNDGKQAIKLVSRLTAQGFEQVFSLAGGIHAWESAGLPLVKKG